MFYAGVGRLFCLILLFLFPVIQIGGYGPSPTYYVNDTFLYDLTLDQWTSLDDLPMKSYSWNCAATFYLSADGVLCAMSKLPSGPSTAMIWMDLGPRTWTTLPETTPTPARVSAAVFVVDGIFYLLGGAEMDTWTDVSTISAFILGNSTWQERSDMDEANDGQRYALVERVYYKRKV